MTPDDELRSEADVAARNGRVYIKGKDEEGHKQEYKTDDHPLNDSVFYDEEVELETQAFSNFAKKIKDKFAEWVSNA
ncbi:hypothetical protein HP15_3108 [Marinobacter adhaerens HP15]|uniref:Uncharacterized protein n=2 Tax=Marinobacter adhaerens TaxID=1033846 RepID=E4PPK1_MARAH|nr:hypothetical protein HP15_3108 [Marinobacter adhaerens HP15]